MKLIKTQLVQLVNNTLILIPLEEVKNGFFDWNRREQNCEFIKITPPEVNLWVYRKTSGTDCMGDESHIANPSTHEELRKLLEEDYGICFIQATDANEISSPSNALGNRSVLIQLTKESIVVL